MQYKAGDTLKGHMSTFMHNVESFMSNKNKGPKNRHLRHLLKVLMVPGWLCLVLIQVVIINVHTILVILGLASVIAVIVYFHIPIWVVVTVIVVGLLFSAIKAIEQ